MCGEKGESSKRDGQMVRKSVRFKKLFCCVFWGKVWYAIGKETVGWVAKYIDLI